MDKAGVDYLFYAAPDPVTYSLDLIHDTRKSAYNFSKQMYMHFIYKKKSDLYFWH